MSSQRVVFANNLRGLAALIVLISHYFGAFWDRREEVAYLINAPLLSPEQFNAPTLVTLINFQPYFNWGAYGVALFFLISGFVIPFSLQRYTWKQFISNRLLRILPTYIVGFTITLTAIYLCSLYFSNPWPFSSKEIIIHYMPAIRDLLNSRNIDGIIWTLEIEMKFYFICLLAIICFRKKSMLVFGIPIILLCLSLVLGTQLDTLQQHALHYFQAVRNLLFFSKFIIFMFIGVVFNYLYQEKLTEEVCSVLVLSFFVMFAGLWTIGPEHASSMQIWSYGAAVLTFALLYYKPHYLPQQSCLDFLAKISYPLYVIHGLTGYIGLRILLDKQVPLFVALSLVTTSAFGLAWLIHRYIEVPTHLLGKHKINKHPSYEFNIRKLRDLL